jgi:serine/threonine-protein kinase
MSAASASKATKDVRGKRLGRYHLIEHLASGGMAEIYLASHAGEGGFSKELVLKVLHQRFAEDENVVGMFAREAQLGTSFKHPGVVDTYEMASEDDVRFIAMEHIPGRTLTELVLRALETGRPLPLPYAAFILGQVADALAYLQEGRDAAGAPLEIVHRDVSPTNIVISDSGQTKLIDFGIAKRGRDVLEGSGARPGKLGYMSPEQVKGLPLDGRSDLFSLGTILYEITVGRRMWRGAQEVVMQRIVEEKAAPPTAVVRDYPPTLELIVLRALEKRPEDRYASAAEMAADLETFVAESGMRVSNRRVAAFLHGLWAPDAQVSEQGALRARAFLEDGGEIYAEAPDVLDFDRHESSTGAGRVTLAHALRDSGPLRALPAGAIAEAPAPVRVPEPAPTTGVGVGAAAAGSGWAQPPRAAGGSTEVDVPTSSKWPSRLVLIVVSAAVGALLARLAAW